MAFNFGGGAPPPWPQAQDYSFAAAAAAAQPPPNAPTSAGFVVPAPASPGFGLGPSSTGLNFERELNTPRPPDANQRSEIGQHWTHGAGGRHPQESPDHGSQASPADNSTTSTTPNPTDPDIVEVDVVMGKKSCAQESSDGNTWKLQCFYCTVTVSTGKLNRNYYKLHLEAVHNIATNCEKLLSYTLNQQIGCDPEENMHQNKAAVPAGVNVISEGGEIASDGSGGLAGMVPTAAQMRHQEQTINRWANACEHGCRLCNQQGKSFMSLNREGLLEHLEQVHKMSGKEYKERFKVVNLITRANNMTCKECGQRVKRTPISLNSHLKKHGMNHRSYWLKHLKPAGVPNMRQLMQNAHNAGFNRPIMCDLPDCNRTFENATALSLHKSWHLNKAWQNRGKTEVSPEKYGKEEREKMGMVNTEVEKM